MKKSSKGFTLIELLIVIAIIVTLTAVVFVALSPAQRLADSRDARRTSDADTILTAIHTAIVDSKGTYPTGLSKGMTEAQIGAGTSGCAISTGGCAATPTVCVNLAGPLSKYLKTLPIDPLAGSYTASATGYSVVVDANGIVSVKACAAENTTIMISR